MPAVALLRHRMLTRRAEQLWALPALQIVREQLPRGSLPSLPDYLAAAAARREAEASAVPPLGGLFGRRPARVS